MKKDITAQTPIGTACLFPLITMLITMLAGNPAWSQVPTAFIHEATLTGDFSELPDQGAHPGPGFGYSVAMDGDWLAVGAPATTFFSSSFGTADHGAVFLYQHDGTDWQYVQRILHPAWGDSQCGFSVALSIPHLVIGCNEADEISNPSTEAGIVRWYRLDGSGTNWQIDSGYHGPPEQKCGTSVAISDVHADGSVVLTIGCRGSITDTGFVVIYSYDAGLDSWSGPEFIFSSDGAQGDQFGASLALWRSTTGPVSQRLAVGAPSKKHGSADGAGSVYLYEGANWTEVDSFTHPAPSVYPYTSYGAALAINETQLIIGSPGSISNDCPDPDPFTFPRCGFVRRFQPDESIPFSGGGSAVNALGNPSGEQLFMRFGNAVALGPYNWTATAAHFTDGYDANGQLAERTGLVELRRADNGGYSVHHDDQRTALRPDPLGPESLAEGHFGTSLDFGDLQLAVGYPFAGNFSGRHGEVWVYKMLVPDQIFSDRFEQP